MSENTTIESLTAELAQANADKATYSACIRELEKSLADSERDLAGARFAARKHLETVETQRRIIDSKPAPGATIDSDEFRQLIDTYAAVNRHYKVGAYAAVVTHIDARIAAAGMVDKRDAEWYRWLREKRDIPHGVRNIPWVVVLDPAEKIHTMVARTGVDLDCAIDVAMNQDQKGGEL